MLNSQVILARRCPLRLADATPADAAVDMCLDPALPLNLDAPTADGLARNSLSSRRVPGVCSIECVKSWVFLG
jgi:hypothetical protein